MGKKAAAPGGTKSRLRFILPLIGGANLAVALGLHMPSLRESYTVQFFVWFYSQWWVLAPSVLFLSPLAYEIYDALSYRSHKRVAATDLKRLGRRLRWASKIARGPSWYPGLGRQEREIERASEILHSAGAAPCPILSLESEAQRKWVSSYFRILADTIEEQGVEQSAHLSKAVESFLDGLFPDARQIEARAEGQPMKPDDISEP